MSKWYDEWQSAYEWSQRYGDEWSRCPTCGGRCETHVSMVLRSAWRYCPRCKTETEDER